MQQNTTAARVVRRRRHPWTPDAGDFVELRRGGMTVQAGRVETVMPDGSGFWLAPEGPSHRRYVLLGDDNLEVWS